MKTLIVMALSLTSISVFAADRDDSISLDRDHIFLCVPTGEERLYDDEFIIDARVNSPGKLKYRRRHSCDSSDTFSDLQVVRGCWRTKATSGSPEKIQVECDRDGEEGLVLINRDTMSGQLYFYMPKIGYGERTLLSISCQEL